ncbi:ABC-type polar amino acid transport system ATPase subunit [Rhizobium sp. BK538]|nr:ABC-type polar amino acid transport system ATPase subunit [Rhizobium sp. BK538]
MLFDEPTSALDPEMVSEVLDTMTRLSRFRCGSTSVYRWSGVTGSNFSRSR